SVSKKKDPTKGKRSKGIEILFDAALTEAAQLKEATKQSKKDFHISHASDSGDGTDFELGVPDEKQRKISGADEGTSTKLGVPDVPKYDSERRKDWVDRDENPNLNQSNEEHEEEEEEYINERVHTLDNYELIDEENMDEEEDDDVTKELYKDVNVNLGNKDAEMTNAEQDEAELHNVSQESGFEYIEEDAHVTLTTVHNIQKTEGPMQSSFISSDFTYKHLNLENTSPTDNDIASLMDTTVHHEETSSQASSLFTVPITVIPEITSVFTINIPPPPPSFNPLPQQTTPTPTPNFKCNNLISCTSRLLIQALAEKNEYIDLINTSVRVIIKVEVNTQLPQAVSDFATLMIEQNVTKSLEVVVLAKSSSQPKSTYVTAASHLEFELMKILMDKIEEQKSYLRAGYKRELYDALVKSYNTDKDLFESYGDFDMGNNDEQPDVEAAARHNWFEQPEKPLTPDPNWNKREHIDFLPPQT
ncbi:hypothetical protein Tco_0291506, partial [Tanacetum coccineum]